MQLNRFLFVTILALFSAQNAYPIPYLISYQGQLNDESGLPVNGSVSFEFRIYDVPGGGTALWTENQTLPVSNGVFNVHLGAVSPLPPSLASYNGLYLGVRVGADQEMTPRQRITSSPYIPSVPVGGIVAWNKSMSGTPALSDGWAECNGQVLDDPASPYHGQSVPDLNGQGRILYGGSTSGTLRSEDYLPSHGHGPGTLKFRTAAAYIGAQASASPSQCTGQLCAGETGPATAGSPFLLNL